MPVATTKDLLASQLRDLFNAETQVRSALERWTDAADSAVLEKIFEDRLKQADRHIERIREICNALDVQPEGEKCHGMEGLIAEGDEHLDEAETDRVRDAGLIANARRIEHYGIAGYDFARTYAERLGHDAAGEALAENVYEASQMDERMKDLATALPDPEPAAA
jgi:ferritin-like metal-binding protein YciE